MMSAMAPPSDDHARHLQKLAALVTQRRVALGFRSKEAGAAACGLSHMPYRNVENGLSVSGTTYNKIEVAFGFRPGSCKAVLEGADSITLEDGTELIEGGQIRDFVNSEVLEEEMDRAFDKSAQLVAPHLTLSESQAIKKEMFEYLRGRGVLRKSE
jgi:hypothetical protein